MARCRSIKPGFMTNERLPELGPHAHLLFADLWMIADREGRLEDRPRRIKLECLPLYDVDADELLSKLAAGPDPFILRYRVGDKAYIQIVKWKENQSPHHTEKASAIPAPPLDNGELPESHGELTTVKPAAHYQRPVTSNQEVLEEGTGGKPKRPRFVKPTVEEVAAYCRERGGKVDAEQWHAYYESNGWRVGKNPMQDWKAAVRTWETNGNKFGGTNGNGSYNRNGARRVPPTPVGSLRPDR